MMRAVAAIAVALALVLTRTPLSAQQPGRSLTRFVDEARSGTRRYQSQAMAIADGFKRVGVEFPAMGEHWVNLQRVMEDTLVPARPSVLIYVNVRGEARLAGVGYTALLQRGEQPPEFPPARPFWHEHNGTVVDESFPLAHHLDVGASSTGDATAALRLSILHAWVWAPNAEGVFATDNWSLPSVRVGAAAPLELSRDALRGLTLAADSSDYYALMVRTGAGGKGGPLTPQEERAIATVLADHRARAAREAAQLHGTHPVPDAAARLATTWLSLWSTLERALPARIPQLRILRQHL